MHIQIQTYLPTCTYIHAYWKRNALCTYLYIFAPNRSRHNGGAKTSWTD